MHSLKVFSGISEEFCTQLVQAFGQNLIYIANYNLKGKMVSHYYMHNNYRKIMLRNFYLLHWATKKIDALDLLPDYRYTESTPLNQNMTLISFYLAALVFELFSFYAFVELHIKVNLLAVRKSNFYQKYARQV